MNATNGTSLAKIKQHMPTPAESKMAQRRANVLAKFTDDDVVDILAALKRKALAGDVGAARVVLAYTIGAPEQAPTTINVGKVVVDEPAGVPKSIAKSRHRIVELIANEGPLDAHTIAVRTGIRRDVVDSCLEHEWFEDEQDGWHITNIARAEVIGDGDTD